MECGRACQGLAETGKVWHRLARCGKVWQSLARLGTLENNRHICHKKYHGVRFTKSGIVDRLVRQSGHGYTPLVEVNQAILSWSF